VIFYGTICVQICYMYNTNQIVAEVFIDYLININICKTLVLSII